MKLIKYHKGIGKPLGEAHLSATVYIYTHPSLQIIGEGGPTNRVRMVLYPVTPIDPDSVIVTPADDELCSFIAVKREHLKVLGE